MTTNVIEIKGERFVLVKEKEYRRLTEAAKPELPPADAKGCRPARQTMLVLMARGITEDREKLGLTQKELADLAGLREETICRLESGRNSPNMSSMQKIERALRTAAKKRPA